MCYVTSRGAAVEARRQLERRTAGAMVQCAVVSALPRAAAVEWHAWAHTDNNRFDCESYTNKHTHSHNVHVHTNISVRAM